MATRADFYVGIGEHAEWLGSIAFDGYEWAEDKDCALMRATTEVAFRHAVAEIAELRDNFCGDWTYPYMGWPWPWDDSSLTDYVYAFDSGRVTIFRFGEINRLKKSKVSWPDMKSKKKVTFGKRSGLIVLQIQDRDSQ